jgi:hypothetical protein
MNAVITALYVVEKLRGKREIASAVNMLRVAPTMSASVNRAVILYYNEIIGLTWNSAFSYRSSPYP